MSDINSPGRRLRHVMPVIVTLVVALGLRGLAACTGRPFGSRSGTSAPDHLKEDQTKHGSPSVRPGWGQLERDIAERCLRQVAASARRYARERHIPGWIWPTDIRVLVTEGFLEESIARWTPSRLAPAFSFVIVPHSKELQPSADRCWQRIVLYLKPETLGLDETCVYTWDGLVQWVRVEELLERLKVDEERTRSLRSMFSHSNQ